MTDPLDFRFPDGELGTAFSVGDVTDRSVRVWLRREEPGPVPARLTIDGRIVAEISMTPDPQHDHVAAGVLALDAPLPDAEFEVQVGGLRRRGRLAPALGRSRGFTFAFASCHQPFEGPDDAGQLSLHTGAGIYPLMRERLLADEARFLLLTGDQVYSDGLESMSVRSRIKDESEISDQVLVETYRHLHRGYFGQAGFRGVTEAVPTYLTWDDHDIFDGWGSQLKPGDLDFRLYRAAETAYREYQHLQNPGASLADAPPFSYPFWFADIGFFVLDLRGCRSYQEPRILGAAQWAHLEAFLTEADARGTATVFIVASVPVVHFSPFIANSLDWVPGGKGTDVRDRWSVAAFAPERERLLTTLFEWQSSQPKRQVVLLSGDVHVATAFHVRPKGGKGVGRITQWTSSALSTPGGLQHSMVNRLGTKLVNLGEGRTHADRHGLATGNNFGTVRVEPRPDGGHALRFSVHEHDRRRNTLRVAFDDASEPR